MANVAGGGGGGQSPPPVKNPPRTSSKANARLGYKYGRKRK